MKTFDEFWEAYSYLTRDQAEDLWNGLVADRKETMQKATREATTWIKEALPYIEEVKELRRSILGNFPDEGLKLIIQVTINKLDALIAKAKCVIISE